MLPTKEQIEAIIQELQKIMRIQDWDIEFRFTNQYELKDDMKAENFDHIGLCDRTPNQKRAIIKINTDHSRFETEWYNVLVHELLHIIVCDLEDICINCMNDGTYEWKHFTYMAEGVNVAFEKIFVKLYPISNFDYILKEVSNETI